MKGNLSIILISICVLALSAVCSCANSKQQEGTRSTFVYECGDDYVFVVRIEGEAAWLFLPGQTIKLPHVPSGSGAKYSNGSVTFWSKGEE
ncbi:MAG: MliC family protein, partial [Candidatus Krumholzibacteria bacterium]|nr:MliC family protein [Candidatus Krumholzibacteria bacterium]